MKLSSGRAAVFAVFTLVLVVLIAGDQVRADWNLTIAASNPLNWYQFNELSGSTCFDHGSEQLNGTYGTGAEDATRGVPGLLGTAVQFGNQSTVFLNAPDIMGDWTAEFVVMRIGSKASSVLIRGIPNTFPSEALKLEQYPNTEQVGYTKYGIVDATFSPSVPSPLNQWMDLVYVNQPEDNTISLYLNGVLAGTRMDNIDLPRDQIGSWSDTVPESPLAIMNEVVIWDRALTATEIAADYAAVPEPSSGVLIALGLLGGLLFLKSIISVPIQRSDPRRSNS